MRILSSAEKCRRVARRMSFNTCSAGSLTGTEFCLIFAPSKGYDEPEILPCSIRSICPIGADDGHFRSSSAYRVRIALNLKRQAVAYDYVGVNFRENEQRTSSYLAIKPQALVPSLVVDSAVLTQSLAIIGWLDETHPEPPLLPKEPLGRATERAFALSIVADIQPLNNLRVLDYLKGPLGIDQTGVDAWYRQWATAGLAACEALATRTRSYGAFAFGDRPTLADICLVPQMYNARRFDCDLGPMPRLRAIDDACAALPEFADAHPDRQPDAVP
jgi:maleylpyruvate isomerase